MFLEKLSRAVTAFMTPSQHRSPHLWVPDVQVCLRKKRAFIILLESGRELQRGRLPFILPVCPPR